MGLNCTNYLATAVDTIGHDEETGHAVTRLEPTVSQHHNSMCHGSSKVTLSFSEFILVISRVRNSDTLPASAVQNNLFHNRLP